VASSASTEDPTTTEATTSTVTSPATTTSEPSTATTTTSTTTTAPPTTPPVPPLLRVGDTGWAVEDLQSRLLVLGRTSGAIDGLYDAQVTTALAGFLSANGLPGDGSEFSATARDLLLAQTATPLAFSATSTGNGVRDLQVRLKLLGYWPYSITGTMDASLATRALTVQRAKDLPQSGVFDTRTWDRIKTLTATPTQISSTASGATVKELQLRLRAKGLWPYAIHGVYDAGLAQRVLAFQRVQNLPQSGVVDRRTWSRLVALTYTAGTFDRYRYEAGLRPILPTLASLDYRCRTGRVMCIDKGTRTLTWVVYGKPTSVMWARFGGPGLETREGTFKVLRRYEYVVSNLYFTPMPYSMFFSGGQAVHYSSNFARIGYAGSSHGCVNIADYAQVKALYFASRIGDKVIVHH
jgi:peptidoglycan hydrolase-like protein with peptidoglycan-binding domain